MSNSKINPTIEYWAQEMQKCKESMAYFMNNYVKPKRDIPYTDEEIEEVKESLRLAMQKRRKRH